MMDKNSLSYEDVCAACSAAGIERAAVDEVFRLREFPGNDMNPKEVLVLLLTFTAPTLSAVAASMFDIFGVDGKMSTQEFSSLFGYMTATDSQISSAHKQELAAELSALQENISYEELCQLPSFAALC
mmetsp:Transcript_11987/g.41594  ORF Transcript_11987/g.41594 Transcript_11987/m.41594 type:complete len:128 (+) Transcript_11987:356-739(+)